MKLGAKTKRERLAEREEAILTAASAAFQEGGLRAAKMADIARAADVAEGTLYLYYKNKEALFAAVVTRHWRDLTEGAQEATAGIDDPEQQLGALASYTLRRIVHDWKLFELSFFLEYGSPDAADPSDRRSYVEVFDRIIRRGVDRGVFAPAVPVRLLRDLFFGTLEYAARSILQRKEQPFDEILKMLEAAMGGALKPDRRPSPPNLADRLEAAVTRLEALAD